MPLIQFNVYFGDYLCILIIQSSISIIHGQICYLADYARCDVWNVKISPVRGLTVDF